MPPDNVIPLPDSGDDLQQQALNWVVRLNSGEATKGDRQAFSEWVEQNTEHRKAFFAARRLWQEMEGLDPIEAWVPAQSMRNGPDVVQAKRSRLRIAYVTAAFGVIAVFGILAKPLVLRYWVADFRTAVGEIRTVHLPDGSTLSLNTDSMVALDFDEHRRNLRLLTGEAVFEVTPNPRPFVVSAGSGKIRALGTRFVVRYTDDQARVSVLEHAVEIRSENHAPVQLNAGYRLAYGEHGLLDIPQALPDSEPDAWRQGKLKFDGRPLLEVLRELDRYLPGKLLLANDRLANHQVSGIFEIEKLDRAVPVIAKSLNLQTTAIGTLLVVIY